MNLSGSAHSAHDVGHRNSYSRIAALICAACTAVIMGNRPQGGIRIIDAYLVVLTGSFEAALITHAIIVFVLALTLIRLIGNRLGVQVGIVVWLLAWVIYILGYVSWGSPLVG